MSKKMKLAGDFDFAEIAQRTPGYEQIILCKHCLIVSVRFVGADLTALTKEAAVICINRQNRVDITRDYG